MDCRDSSRAKTSIEDFTISQESLVDGGKWIFKGLLEQEVWSNLQTSDPVNEAQF